MCEITELPTEYEDLVFPFARGVVTLELDVAAPVSNPHGRVIALDGDPKDWPIEERPWIYVAGYYSACPSQGIANATKWAERLTDAGWNAFVPHFSFLYDMLMPMPPEWWYAYDLGLLTRMDAMFVCPDLLTRESTGVAKEIAFCTRNDIPVFHEVVEAKDRYAQ